MIPEYLRGWRPGVLCNTQLKTLCDEKVIDNVEDKKACKESSIDLTLGSDCWEMRGGSIKPFGQAYNTCLKPDLKKEPNGENIYELKKGNTYVFKLRERLQIAEDSHLYGEATAKSTIGRTDVLARLIVDRSNKYEGFDDMKGIIDLYLEVTPITFDVIVKEGISLSQLRLFFGKPEFSEVTDDELVLYGRDILSIPGESDIDIRCLSVDLSNLSIGDKEAAAFCAKENLEQPLDLWKKEEAEKPNPCDFWKLKRSIDKRFAIKHNAFYILRSLERISLPSHLAVYCRAMDETIGEMRIHYAGFVHPNFGGGRSDDKTGTPLIFEVRGHNVDVSLGHKEILAKLTYYRMSKEPEFETPSYGKQELDLSNIFAEWPDELEIDKDGNVKKRTEEDK